jgi:predicted nuclease of predicted toxin-antitoxin system
MKLLVDMNLSPGWIPYLEKQGVEAVHWSTIGAGNAPDEAIFAHAQATGLIIFTHDLDFTTILAHAGTRQPSLIQARVQDVSPDSLGPAVVAALRQFTVELEKGAVVTLLPDRNKVRILPI